MKLEEKIRDRKIVYLVRRSTALAFELALLYFCLAKRKNAREKVGDVCLRSIYWLKIAGIAIPEYLKHLSPFGQLEEIERILVVNKAKADVPIAIA